MSKSTPIHTAEVASPELDKRIEESIAKVVPAILARFFSSGGLVTSQEPPTKDMASSSPSNQTNRESLLIGVNASSQLRKIFSSLDLTTKAFTKPLTKEKWKEIFSQSTKKRYQAPWWVWSHWCSSKGLCPFSVPVTDVLTFSTELVTSRSLEYWTLAVYKSAISQGHLLVGQTRLGDLPVVSRFMKGMKTANTSFEFNLEC